MAISFLHPSIQTNIFDNSERFPVATYADVPTLYQPFFSERGETDYPREYGTLSSFVEEFGYPNFRKYGQPIYNAYNWLENGGRVVAVRLMAQDATYSNIVLNVLTKANDDNTIDIVLKTYFLDGLNDSDTEFYENLCNEIKVEDEYPEFKSHFLMGFRCKGKGVYGNNYAFRITSNSAYRKTYHFASYNLTMMEVDEAGTLKKSAGPIGCAVCPEAMSNAGNSLFIDQIIADYFPEVKLYYNENVYDELIDDIMLATNNAYDDITTIDFLLGDDHCLVTDDTDNLFSFSGCYFKYGSNGSTGIKATNPETVLIRDDLMLNAFNGTMFPQLYDKKLSEIDVVLDANFNTEIKEMMNDFVSQRGDCVAILDTGIHSNASDVVTWKQMYMGIDNYLTSYFSQHLTLFDTHCGRDITVPSTYFLAKMIPTNDGSNGIQTTFVGPRRGVITGFKSLSWNPNDQEKELLYENRINYIEESYGDVKFMGQQTSQSKVTALSDINHVRTMLKIIRSVERLMEKYLFEPATDSTISSINGSLSSILSEWVSNGACTTCTGTCTQTIIERENKTAHVVLNIVFVDVLEKIIIDVNINR